MHFVMFKDMERGPIAVNPHEVIAVRPNDCPDDPSETVVLFMEDPVKPVVVAGLFEDVVASLSQGA